MTSGIVPLQHCWWPEHLLLPFPAWQQQQQVRMPMTSADNYHMESQKWWFSKLRILNLLSRGPFLSVLKRLLICIVLFSRLLHFGTVVWWNLEELEVQDINAVDGFEALFVLHLFAAGSVSLCMEQRSGVVKAWCKLRQVTLTHNSTGKGREMNNIFL